MKLFSNNKCESQVIFFKQAKKVLIFSDIFHIITLTEPNTPLNDADHVGLFNLWRNFHLQNKRKNSSQQTFDDRPFAVTGADLEKYRIVGLKSSVHFRAFFQPRAKAIVIADLPGIHMANFHQLSYKKIRRPVYPLDPETTFGGVNHG